MSNQILNCMTFIAGKAVAKNHRVMVGHNEDDGGLNFVRHAYVPARDWPEGSVLPAEPGLASVPQIAHTFGYYWAELKNEDGGLSTSDIFTNDNGVVIVSNGMSLSSESNDDTTIVRDGGIGYNMRRILAERAKSARDGARILTELIDTWGYAFSGRAYTIADKDEAFMFQLVRGRHYIGARVPDNAVVVMPNHYDFHKLDDCPEMFYPDDIVTYAIEKGWYTPGTAGDYSDFDFALAYQHPRSRMHTDNTFRYKHGARIVLNREWDMERDGYPFAIYPDHELDVSDFACLLRTHYEGTPDGKTGFGPGHTPHGVPSVRRICAVDTLVSQIWQFDEKPELTTVFTAMGRPCCLPYLPLHPLYALPSCLCENMDPCRMMDDHLQPEAEIAWYRDSVSRRCRDICCRDDLVYSDEHDTVAALVGEMLTEALAENEEELRVLRGLKKEEAAEYVRECDGAYIEKCMQRLMKAVKISPVRILSVNIPGGDTVAVTMETAESITETEMLLGIDMTNLNADYAKVLPGSLRRTEDGFYHAEFSVEPLRKYLRGGKRIFWLGGRLADGHPFAANIIADT